MTNLSPNIGPPKSLTLLGSTGSIGQNTLNLVRNSLKKFEVIALTGNKNVKLLIEQAREFLPKLVVVADAALYSELKRGLSGTDIQVGCGLAALNDAAELNSDIVIAGIVGIAGLTPTLTAIKQGGIVALANKECLVCAGQLFIDEIVKSGATLIPVDSEHNAIFQVFDFEKANSVESLTLTASGGPFLNTSLSEMAAATPMQAKSHPNWKMGAKISVDSATMMNKGLELIEAYYLFPVEEEQINVVIHPQSVIHSLVNYKDGSVLAQLGTPDMRTPISYALAWPERMETNTNKLDLAKVGNLSFQAPDHRRFPAIDISRNCLKGGAVPPIVLNAANEIAVDAFLENRIGFLDIVRIVEEVLAKIHFGNLKSIEDIYSCDIEAREKSLEILSGL